MLQTLCNLKSGPADDSNLICFVINQPPNFLCPPLLIDVRMRCRRTNAHVKNIVGLNAELRSADRLAHKKQTLKVTSSGTLTQFTATRKERRKILRGSIKIISSETIKSYDTRRGVSPAEPTRLLFLGSVSSQSSSSATGRQKLNWSGSSVDKQKMKPQDFWLLFLQKT